MGQPPANATVKPTNPQDRKNLGRRFGVLDAMILVAAGAVGAISIRPFMRFGRSMPEFFDEFFPISGRLAHTAYLDVFFKFMGPWLASLTLAFLAIRLRKPRPPLRRLMRQPGMIACTAASLLLAIEATGAVIVFAIFGLPNPEDFYFKYLQGFIGSASVAVVAVWGSIALAGRWKSEPRWIDRMGRLIGATWLVIFISMLFFDGLFQAINHKYSPNPRPYLSIEEEKKRDVIEQRERDLQLEALRKRVEEKKQQNKALEEENRAIEQENLKSKQSEVQSAKP